MRCSTVKSVFNVSNNDVPLCRLVPDSSRDCSTNTVDAIGRPKNNGVVMYALDARDPTVYRPETPADIVVPNNPRAVRSPARPNPSDRLPTGSLSGALVRAASPAAFN